MIIAHNLSAQNAQRQLKLNTKHGATSMERLSSGFRINRAADDAAGLAISEKMRAQIRGLDQGTRNVQDGISFCNVADGALNEVHAVLGRIRELAVQAASDTYVESDRRAIDDEFEQLKDEINRISRTTEFNTMRIFDDGAFKIEFSDDVCPIKIFNATNGSPDDPETYGGVIVGNDTRIPWNSIHPDMVSLDPNTGEPHFRAGEYHYKTFDYDFTIKCEEGSKPPEIKVEFIVSADSNGIRVAGNYIFWEDVINDDGECILDHLGEEGYYHFGDTDGAGSFYVEAGASLSDIVSALNQYNKTSNVKTYSVYDGYYTTQAVDVVDAGTTVQLTQDIYNNSILQGNDIDVGIRLQADQNGIWAIDHSGNEISGSRKSWASMRLSDWNSGSDVSDRKTYRYNYSSADNSINISFDYFLTDETSKDAVIEGINDMKLEDWSHYGNTDTTLSLSNTGRIISGKVLSENNNFSVTEQGKMGRDFDTKIDNFATADLIFDETTNSLSAVLQSNNGIPDTMLYNAPTFSTADYIKSSSASALQYLNAKAIQAVLAGNTGNASILDVIGTDHITNTGYLSETYTVTPDTIKTSALQDSTYPSASVDFSELGTKYQLHDLLGTGFDSTCMTCSNHYSVLFVYGDSAHTTDSGYGFTTAQNGLDYTLHIDLKSMMEKGINDGASFTKALVDIFDDADAHFDFHFTQYATDSSGVLYVCDNRSNYVGTTTTQNATFYVAPYNVNSIDLFANFYHTGSNKQVNLTYDYDVGSLLSGQVSAVLEEDPDGLFIKNAAGKALLYTPKDYYDENNNLLPGITAPPTRYSVRTTDTGAIDWETVYDTIWTEVAAQPGFSVVSEDYAFLRCTTNENPSDAYISFFRTQREEKEDEGMWIQAGANQFQGLFLKWDGFSSHTLGLSHLSMTDRDEAGRLITRTDIAIQKISRIRSAFGAYTNRLEHIQNMNTNYSENLQAAESTLRDADMAKEVLEHTKSNILSQATQSILSQTMRSPEQILQLLQ